MTKMIMNKKESLTNLDSIYRSSVEDRSKPDEIQPDLQSQFNPTNNKVLHLAET